MTEMWNIAAPDPDFPTPLAIGLPAAGVLGAVFMFLRNRRK
jgi:hypothetical protein